MTEERAKRKLSAILSADVKGYSILMADDEAYTVKKIEEYRDSMSALIRLHSGPAVAHRTGNRTDFVEVNTVGFEPCQYGSTKIAFTDSEVVRHFVQEKIIRIPGITWTQTIIPLSSNKKIE